MASMVTGGSMAEPALHGVADDAAIRAGAGGVHPVPRPALPQEIMQLPLGHSRLDRDYAEVFVVQEGALTFVVGNRTLEVRAGQIVIAPAGVPHKFTNTTAEVARHVDIHTSRKMETTWLEG